MRNPDNAKNEDCTDGSDSAAHIPPDCGLFRRIDTRRPAKFTIARRGCQRSPERKCSEIKAFFSVRDGLQRLGEVDRKTVVWTLSPSARVAAKLTRRFRFALAGRSERET
jgi:hypothetical protein